MPYTVKFLRTCLCSTASLPQEVNAKPWTVMFYTFLNVKPTNPLQTSLFTVENASSFEVHAQLLSPTIIQKVLFVCSSGALYIGSFSFTF